MDKDCKLVAFQQEMMVSYSGLLAFALIPEGPNTTSGTSHFYEHNVSSLHCNVSACANGNAHISLGKGRRVIDTISYHCHLRGEKEITSCVATIWCYGLDSLITN